MTTTKLFARLAAATLFVAGLTTAAEAQVRRVPVRPAPTYSSSSATDGVKFGIRAGVNVADFSGDAVDTFKDFAALGNGALTQEMKPGFYAGLYVTLPLGPRFAIEPGLGYSEKGVRLNGRIPFEQFEFLNAKLDGTARLAYLDIPILAKAYITDGLYVYAGPQASLLLSGKARVKASAFGFTAYQNDFDIKNRLQTLDFAVVGGLGYQFQNGFGLNAGYDYGLVSLDKNNNFDIQNRVIKASLNYSF
ncbi:porin family protein [Hymenobacter terrestris]|uniref:PorT family protein n=1 Tax=Hymenobacter terrestris TaxID=2748310 RepID=A0ABX2Q4T3_9BACT|nr:porin family protein [Hymenobacter terrestris]NVO85524.1 PorT family protein [Hymenobacter terrestris]